MGIDPKTFCVLPFCHVVLNPYNSEVNKSMALPCCRYNLSGLEKNVESDFINSSKTWSYLQGMILSKQKAKECQHCWRDEEESIESYRQSNLRTFEHLIKSRKFLEKKLVYLELMFGNTCNLSCRSCSSTFSSKWAPIDKHLNDNGINTQQTKNLAFSDWRKLDLTHLEKLKIMGGEPFYQKTALELLEYLSSIDVLKNISLIIPTNCTITPSKQWKKLLLEAKHVHLILSIDGINDVAEYVRMGSNWTEVNNNIKIFYDFADSYEHIFLTFGTVVSVYNINKLEELRQYLTKNYPKCSMYFDLAYYPEYLDIALLPQQIKEEILNTSLLAKFPKIVNYLNSKTENIQAFEKLKKVTTVLDEYHGKYLNKVNPQLHDWIMKYE